MNKIRMTADRETNFVFHMLSVAGCGYDNAYGESHRSHYPEEDLAVIRENGELLTVCGGEHCGALYWYMVSEPACGKVPAKEYYAALGKRAMQGDLPPDIQGYAENIRRISDVMIRHYDYYVEKIWPEEQRKITAYIPAVSALFEETNFTEQAEELVGCKLMSEYFTATMVTSVENGAEAIDISREKDVFGIVRAPLDSFYFIGHEFIIYLLFHALKEENAFRSMNTWGLTEGLAEYYLKKITGDVRFFDAQRKYVEFYEQCERERPLSAAELYRMGLQKEGIGEAGPETHT